MRIFIEAPERRRRSMRRRGAVTATLVTMLAAPLLTVVGPVQALDPTAVGPVDPRQRSFPAYYTDDAGLALQMCDDGSGSCLLARPRDLAPPEGEALYWAATGELVSPGIELSVEFAVEAAWLGNEQVVFDRLRVRGHVDQQGTYTLLHPYGTTTLTAEDPVEDRNVNFTEDIGCEPAPGGQCDFSQLASDPNAHITTWLRSTQATGRYLGNPERPTTVTGGERQFMTVVGPAGAATTNQFGVLGKRANPRAVSMPARVDFGNTRRGGRERVRLVNIGTQPLSIRRVAFSGSRTLRRFATPNACGRGDVLRVGRRCTVGIRYRPDGRRRSSARLRITDDTPRGVRTVRIRALTAAELSAPRRVRFAARRGGTSSPTRRIVLSNTGGTTMVIRGVALRGPGRGSFDRRSGAPRVCSRGTRVPVGGQCGIYVGFEPRGFGTKRARFVVRSNSLDSRRTIRLFGFGS